ncbi:MAG: TrkH family potassium uptake protein [Actinobacteria bacterium]|nr:TrkH family potassium uptake protein [Actinomycetota bacterium]
MTSDPASFRYIDALFTATSAVCVTGLVTVDTATVFTPLGKAVIAVLIQIGGLGIMTGATVLFVLTGRRIGLQRRLIVQETLGHVRLSGIVRLVLAVLAMTAAFESVGAAVLAAQFALRYDYPFVKAVGYGAFHAVSAFNNAGFALFSDNLEGFRTDWVVSLTVALLIIFGGLGFPVILEVVRRRGDSRHASLQAKIVLSVTAGLLAFGTLGFLLVEWDGTAMAGLTGPQRVLAAFFQAVTPRTAGFNTVSMAAVDQATVFIMIFLMFVGASPESTGGGIKTTTFGVILASIWATARGKTDVEAFSRRIGQQQVFKALTVLSFSSAFVFVMTVLLLATGRSIGVTEGLFEVISAFGTVGLSLGLTPALTTVGKVLIILTMYTGRVGPVTLGVALAARQRAGRVTLPEEQLPLG